MSTNINFDKKLGISGGTEIVLPSSSAWADTTSMLYDGFDDYLQNSSTFDTLDSNTQFSISVWVKINSLHNGFVFHSSDSAGTGTQAYIYLRNSGRVDVFSGGSGSNWTRSTINLAVGSWYHIVMTLDQTQASRYNMQKIYINGIRAGTSNYFGGNMGDGLILNIGRQYNTGSNYLDGLLDELSIWSGHSLSQAEVTGIFNGGIANDLNNVNTPPTSWYRTENGIWSGSEWTLTDEMGNGTDLISRNMVEANRTTDVPT